MNARRLNNLKEITTLFKARVLPYIASPHLDFGCGNGLGTMFTAIHLPESLVFGYDIDQDKLRQAEILIAGSSLQNLSFTSSKRDIEGRNFPTAMANFVYHEHPALMGEVYPLIAPNGKLFILDYDLKGISRRDFLKRFCCDNEKKVLIREGPENCYQKHTAKSLQDCVADTTTAGFKVEGAYSSGGYFALIGVKK